MRKDIIFDPQMTTYDMAALEALVEQYKPEHALEVGSWKGLSSSIIARHAAVLYCVDTWRGAPDEQDMTHEAGQRDVFQVFCSNMGALNLQDKIKPMIMTSDQARKIFVPDHLDFIYIDGDHTYESVAWDLDWWGQLKVGGVMAGHDYDAGHPGVRRALDERFPGAFKVLDRSSIWFLQKGK